MKILIYGINYAPELTGIGKYTAEMAEWLVLNGHDVRVVTAPPYYPEWRIKAGYSGWRYSREVRQGVVVFRSPIWVPKSISGLNRLLHLLSFSVTSAPVLFSFLRWRPAIVITIAPSFFCTFTALIFCLFSRSRSWLHIQDYEVDAAFALGILKGKRLEQLAKNFELYILKKFSIVSSISEKMVDLALKKGVAHDRIRLLKNWADISSISPLVEQSIFRERLGIASEKIVALYSGNMGEKQGLDIIARCAKILLDNRNLIFVFCGDGSGRKSLEIECSALENVIFLDLQPVELLNDLLGLADIHLLPQRADAEDLVMPSKLTGMLASGRTVIASANLNTQVGQIINDVGFLVPPGNSEKLAEAVAFVASDPVLRRNLGDKAREYAVLNFAKNNILEKFEIDVNTLCAPRS